MNQNDEKRTVIDNHMSHGKATRSFPFGKLPSESRSDREEKKDENSKIGMKAGGKYLPFTIEQDSKANEKAETEKKIEGLSTADMFLPWEGRSRDAAASDPEPLPSQGACIDPQKNRQ